MERTCDFMRSLIARPAASSPAVLMRMPLERRPKFADRALPVLERLRCAFREDVLVRMLSAMMCSSSLRKSGCFGR
jgi:hypothetical protein